MQFIMMAVAAVMGLGVGLDDRQTVAASGGF